MFLILLPISRQKHFIVNNSSYLFWSFELLCVGTALEVGHNWLCPGFIDNFSHLNFGIRDMDLEPRPLQEIIQVKVER